MAIDGLALEEMKPVGDGTIVSVTFVYVCVASSKVCRNETETRIMVFEPYAYCPLVSGHSSEASL